MLTKDSLTDCLLETPFQCSMQPKPEYATHDILSVLQSNEALPMETWALIYEWLDEGEWLVFDAHGNNTDYVDKESVTGTGMYGNQMPKCPRSIFMNGVDTFWPVYTAGSAAFATWNFCSTVSIHQFKVRAEEYDNFGHFASEILLYCGMDETHESYSCGIKLATKQCAGWQYFYDIDLVKGVTMSGKYWRIVINQIHDPNRYGEIAQIDMRGFVHS
eukprot:CAMPEP_0197036366 /NCGR_PEP_ID=MMETSP1384-20130603/13897_1 /TAXON_ID=29189 /ORGANISM="Ammonia sp." /LENGTH=216 /DNA_ID=CAMNT_0042466541 /DNA_START=15 /DNA_END=665 /DNA_ORIENTATION=+